MRSHDHLTVLEVCMLDSVIKSLYFWFDISLFINDFLVPNQTSCRASTKIIICHMKERITVHY